VVATFGAENLDACPVEGERSRLAVYVGEHK
jgi:hypothetical protein